MKTTSAFFVGPVSRRARLWAAAALAAALLGGCAGGVQHIYPEERPTTDRFDPRPDPDRPPSGLFSGGGWRKVQDAASGLAGGGSKSEPQAPGDPDAPIDETAPPPLDVLPPVGQDPGPEQI